MIIIMLYHLFFYIYSRFADSTMAKIKWAVNLFKEWQQSRNQRALDPANVGNISPISVALEDMTVDEINYSISRFVCELRKANGR